MPTPRSCAHATPTLEASGRALARAQPFQASRWPPALRAALSRSHLSGLDGLRMVAALLVVFYHLGWEWVPGGHGVLLFFVLSGCLITWLLLEERERSGVISLRGFYLRRALRILPAFCCFWLLWTAALVLSGKRILWGQALSAFVYLSDYYNAIFGDPNTGYSHTWSLGVEEKFYLLWPVSLLVLLRRPARAPAVLAATIGFVWVYRVVLQLLGVGQQYFYSAFDTRADHLLMGCLLAFLLHEGRLRRLWEWLCTPSLSVVVGALLATSIGMSQVHGFWYRDVVGFAIDPALMAILVVQALALRESLLWRWLDWPWVTFLGRISYSIYLYQQVLVHPVKHALASAPLILQIGVTLGAIVLVAAASYYLIERPFLRLKQTLAGKDRTPAPAYPPSARPALTDPAPGDPRDIPDAIGNAWNAYAEGLTAVAHALESLPERRGDAQRHVVDDWLGLARTSKESFVTAVDQSFEVFERECRRRAGVAHSARFDPGPVNPLERWAESWKDAGETLTAIGSSGGAYAEGARRHAESARHALEDGLRAWQRMSGLSEREPPKAGRSP